MSDIEATATFLQSLGDKERDLLLELCATIMAASHEPPKPVNLVVLGRGPAVPEPEVMADLEPGISPETRELVRRGVSLSPALENLLVRIANTSFVDGENDSDEQHS